MRLIPIAGVMGALAIAAGAFGAHWLAPRVSASLMEAYRSGVQYHLVHSVVLLALGLYGEQSGKSVGAPAKWLLIGTCLFSGSLYVLCFTGLRQVVYLTPVGGLLMMVGWLEIARSLGSKARPNS